MALTPYCCIKLPLYHLRVVLSRPYAPIGLPSLSNSPGLTSLYVVRGTTFRLPPVSSLHFISLSFFSVGLPLLFVGNIPTVVNACYHFELWTVCIFRLSLGSDVVTPSANTSMESTNSSEMTYLRLSIAVSRSTVPCTSPSSVTTCTLLVPVKQEDWLFDLFCLLLSDLILHTLAKWPTLPHFLHFSHFSLHLPYLYL